MAITFLALIGCKNNPEFITYDVINPTNRIFTYEDLKSIGFKKNRTYDVSELEGAIGAWYGFWGKDAYSRKEYEIRIYQTHEDAVALGEDLAQEVTGNDAVITKNSTWKEGIRDRRTIGGPGSGGGGRSGTFPKYGNYSIYGNIVMLCEGQVDLALEVCWELIRAIQDIEK